MSGPTKADLEQENVQLKEQLEQLVSELEAVKTEPQTSPVVKNALHTDWLERNDTRDKLELAGLEKDLELKNQASKPGHYTSEFWLSVLVVICASILLFSERIDADGWALAIGVQGAGYALSRGIAKK